MFVVRGFGQNAEDAVGGCCRVGCIWGCARVCDAKWEGAGAGGGVRCGGVR